MSVMRNTNICIALILSVLVFGCSSPKKDDQAFLDSLNTSTKAEPAISEETLKEIIQQIPSPLEISFLIKDIGTKYDRSILNPTDNLSHYNSNFQKAINLGIYGTDLGYTNIFEQNQDGLSYLTGIKELADGLSLGQFFDITTLKRLATNSKNLDSLLLITTQNFEKINQYLQDQKRSNLSILLLTGGWLEALHITCQINQAHPNKALADKIGEQKIIIDQLMLLLSFYENDPTISNFTKDLKQLHDVYNQIEIVTTYEESTFKEVDGVLTVVNNSSSSVKVTEQNLADITKITASIREKVTK
jgi:hypothetical protein